jgi:phage host-nuclease inhibitor protein Gam
MQHKKLIKDAGKFTYTALITKVVAWRFAPPSQMNTI